jgi:hypothetical protein
MPGRPLNQPPKALGVPVTLVVGLDGRVEQIFWDQLPALTNDQFRRLEALIREKSYAAGQTINELVDVRSLLNLQASPLVPSPAGVAVTP